MHKRISIGVKNTERRRLKCILKERKRVINLALRVFFFNKWLLTFCGRGPWRIWADTWWSYSGSGLWCWGTHHSMHTHCLCTRRHLKIQIHAICQVQNLKSFTICIFSSKYTSLVHEPEWSPITAKRYDLQTRYLKVYLDKEVNFSLILATQQWQLKIKHLHLYSRWLPRKVQSNCVIWQTAMGKDGYFILVARLIEGCQVKCFMIRT